jgi:hypothetical protein
MYYSNSMRSRLLGPTLHFDILHPPLPWQWLWGNNPSSFLQACPFKYLIEHECVKKNKYMLWSLDTHISLIRSPILEILSAMNSTLHCLHIYHFDFQLKKKILPSNFEKILWSNKFLKVPLCRNYFL